MKRKILIIVIAVISLFIIFLTIYYFQNKKSEDQKIYFNKIEFSDERKTIEYTEDFEKTHPEYIINNDTNEINFEIIIEDKGTIGKVYISSEGYIYVYDKILKTSYKISDIKFTKMKSDSNCNSGFVVYAISTSSEIYIVKLNELDINKTTIKKLDTDIKIKAFTSLWVPNFENIKDQFIIALSTDNKLYILPYMIMYNSKMIIFNNQYYVYEDNTIANVEGYLLKDGESNNLKIKYYFLIPESIEVLKNSKTVIITKDNKLIFIDDNNRYLYICNKKVKSVTKIGTEKINYFEGNKIKIIFENGHILELKAVYYEGYYGL